jgi:hypothetical protein
MFSSLFPIFVKQFMPNSRKISTRIAEVSIDNDGIILIRMLDSIDVDEYDVLDLNLIIRHLSKNKPALKLVDSRNNWTISPKAKQLAAKESTLNKTKARAVVVSNVLTSGVLSFLKKFESKKYPQKYFTDINVAREWLLKLNTTKS